MTIRFLSNTNIRRSLWDFSQGPIGMMYQGTELSPVAGPYIGRMIQDVNTYYCYNDNWYFWAGAVEEVAPTEEQGAAPGQAGNAGPADGSLQIPEREEQEFVEDAQDLYRVDQNVDPVGPSDLHFPNVPEGYQEADEDSSAEQRRLPSGEQVFRLPAPARLPVERTPASVGLPRSPDGYNGGPAEVLTTETEFSAPSYSRKSLLSGARPVLPSAFLANRMDPVLAELRIVEEIWTKRALTGYGVNIALLDTGIADHPDLADAVVAKANFCGAKEQPGDQDGQGTHCAGLIAARGNHLRWGLAPEAGLVVAKVMSTPWDLQLDRFLKAVDWVMNYPIDIIYTGASFDLDSMPDTQRRELDEVLYAVISRGVIVIAPVRSNWPGDQRQLYPAASRYCLAVDTCSQSQGPFSSHAIHAPASSFSTTAIGGGLNPGFTGPAAAASCCTGLLALAVQYAHQNQPDIDIPGIMDLIHATAIKTAGGCRIFDLPNILSGFSPYLEQ